MACRAGNNGAEPDIRAGFRQNTPSEKTLDRLRGRVPCAVITGDQRTDNDARRLQGKGATVRQIETISACHLNAERVGQLLPEVTRDGAKLLFIENVGNLVCPAAFDLGENFKVALLSTTEGEDKPEKYPALFSLAPVVVLTKMDLAPHLDWSLARCRENLRRMRPGVFVFELSARTGDGMDQLRYPYSCTKASYSSFIRVSSRCTSKG